MAVAAALGRISAKERVLWLLVAVLASAHLASLLFGPIDGHDAGLHLSWLYGFSRAADWSDWLPRWIPTALRGLGAPILDHYPPLAYMTGSCLYHATSVSTASGLFRLVGLAGYVLSILSMYWYSRSESRFDARLAVLVSLLYAFNPYRFHTLITRSALSEHFAFIWIPIVLLAASRMRTRNSLTWTAVLGLSLGLLFLTNVPIALVTSIALVIYALYAMRDWRTVVSFGVAAVLAVGAGAAFLLPALATNSQFNEAGLLHVGEHSPLLEALTSGYIQNRVQLPLLFIFTAVIFFQVWRRRISSPVAMIVLGMCLVLEVPFLFQLLSAVIPPLGLIQFPWRANPVVFALLIPAFVSMMMRHRSARASMVFFVSCTMLVAAVSITTLAGLRVGVHGSEDEIRPEYYPRHSTLTAERASQLMIGAADEQSPAARARAGLITISREASQRQLLTRNDTGSSDLSMKLFYWPGLSVTVDGVPAAVRPDSLGLATISLPSGHSTATITAMPSPIEQFANALSLCSIGFSVLAIGAGAWARSAKRKQHEGKENAGERAVAAQLEA
jgi:hypothetical protein